MLISLKPIFSQLRRGNRIALVNALSGQEQEKLHQLQPVRIKCPLYIVEKILYWAAIWDESAWLQAKKLLQHLSCNRCARKQFRHPLLLQTEFNGGFLKVFFRNTQIPKLKSTFIFGIIFTKRRRNYGK